MMKEIFKQVKDTDLEISNAGVLRNMNTKKIYKLRYVGAYLKCSDSVVKNRDIETNSIHRIVYYTHKGDWKDYNKDSFIDHIDRDTKNNNISNLRKVDKSTSAVNRTKYSIKLFYNINTKQCYITDNIMLLAKLLNKPDSNFYAVLNKKSKSYLGWIGSVVDIDYSDYELNSINLVNCEDVRYSNIIKSLQKECSKSKKHNIVDKEEFIIATNIHSNKTFSFKYKDRQIFCDKYGLEKRRLSECINKGISHRGFNFKKANSNIDIRESIVEIKNESMFNDYPIWE